MSTWTIYLLRDPADPMRGYVGQTRKRPEARLRQHLALARRGSPQAVHRWIARLASSDDSPTVTTTTLQVADSQDEANLLEQCWMRWARKGMGLVLLNRRRGGGEFDGIARSEAAKMSFADPVRRGKNAEHCRRLVADPDLFAKRVAGIRAAHHRPKHSKSMTEVWRRPGYKDRLRQANRTAQSSPESRAKQAARFREINARPDVKAKVDAARKARWNDPGYKTRVAASISVSASAPEAKARRSAASSARWADPVYRARMLARMAEVRATKEWQEEMRAGHARRWQKHRNGVSVCGQ